MQYWRKLRLSPAATTACNNKICINYSRQKLLANTTLKGKENNRHNLIVATLALCYRMRRGKKNDRTGNDHRSFRRSFHAHTYVRMAHAPCNAASLSDCQRRRRDGAFILQCTHGLRMQTTKGETPWILADENGTKTTLPVGAGLYISFLSPVLYTLAQSGHLDVRTHK